MWRVLFADDEPFVREGLVRLIEWEELGYELKGVYKNGKELIEAMPNQLPDLVILDIKMPILDGLEAARIVQNQWPEVFVIILTAYAEFQYAQDAIEAGVCSYVLKSNLLDELPSTLRRLTERLQQRKEERRKLQDFMKHSLMEKEVPETAEASEPDEKNENEIVRMTEQYVESRLSQKITLDEIAAAVFVNRSYLSYIYKASTGENLFEMINRRRVELAKEYIRCGNKKIYEIGYLVGLEDPAYFSKIFKRFTGMSPKEYAKKLDMNEDSP